MTVHLGLALFGLASLAAAPGTIHSPAAGDQVVVVITSGVPAYDEALEGFRKAAGGQGWFALDLRQKGSEQALNEALRSKGIKVAVGIGSEAAEAVMAQHPSVPVIAAAAMPHLLSNEPARGRVVSVIAAQAPLGAVLENVKRVFPSKSRLAMIRDPALPEAGADSMRAAAEAAGFVPRIVDCPGPAQLLELMQSLKDQVDLVLCLPDASLYNSATIKPLVLASLRYRLPLIGFSEGFVRAGAAIGVYQDFHDAGARAAELALKVLNGQPVPRVESLRNFRVAVNQNITRLLGLTYKHPAGAGDGFIIIR